VAGLRRRAKIHAAAQRSGWIDAPCKDPFRGLHPNANTRCEDKQRLAEKPTDGGWHLSCLICFFMLFALCAPCNPGAVKVAPLNLCFAAMFAVWFVFQCISCRCRVAVRCLAARYLLHYLLHSPRACCRPSALMTICAGSSATLRMLPRLASPFTSSHGVGTSVMAT